MNTPNKDYWEKRHNQAIKNPEGVEKLFVLVPKLLLEYSIDYKDKVGILPYEDGYSDVCVREIFNNLLSLQNCETGRLDNGKTNSMIRDIAKKCGINDL
jgi:hypothetical protein